MKTIASVLLIALLAVTMATAGFFVARTLRSRAAIAETNAPANIVGKPAPSLSVPALDGSVIDLKALRGKTVVLNFWASWCGPCVEEMPVLDRFARSRSAEGFVVIGVAVEEEADARAFLQSQPVSYRIGFGSAASPDESAAFGNRRNVLPYSVLIDADGIVRRAQARSFDDGELAEWVRW